MSQITDVGNFMINTMVTFWSAIGTWGTIGFSIVVLLILPKLLKVIKHLFSI